MKTFIVDAFTSKKFAGNPAGVCILESVIGDDVMLRIAQELNLSETAFVWRVDGGKKFLIRYFSPKTEIPLCGHATLASARVIFRLWGTGQINFLTGSGLDLRVNAIPNHISMVFPVYDTTPAAVPTNLLHALGLREVKNVAYNAEFKILLVEISDSGTLSRLAPDFSALLKSHDSINGVLVTAPSVADEYDFHSRYFWPWSGTNEDPVTGGTHTFLAKYWAERLGKTKMKSFQSSSRSGTMDIEIVNQELTITSQAIVVLEGELLV